MQNSLTRWVQHVLKIVLQLLAPLVSQCVHL